QAPRRVPGRDLGPGGAGAPQPDPAAVADRAGAAGPRGGRAGRAGAGRALVGVPGGAPPAAVPGRVGLAPHRPPAGPGDPARGARRVDPDPARAARAEPRPATPPPPRP